MCMRYKPIEKDMIEEVKGKSRETARNGLRSYQTPIAPSTLPTKYFLCPKNIEFRIMFSKVLSKNIEPLYS